MSLRLTFLSKDSLLLWIIHRYASRKREYRSIFDGKAYPNLEKLEFRHPNDLAQYLEELEI